MTVTGLWKVSEVNVYDEDFNQSWKTTEEITADENIGPMQKAMARAAYLFEEDGTLLSLMPKEIAGGEGEAYDDNYVIAKKTAWKEQEGRLYAAAEENGSQDWQEIVQVNDALELFGFQRIVRA